jgi:hypothetical protein
MGASFGSTRIYGAKLKPAVSSACSGHYYRMLTAALMPAWPAQLQSAKLRTMHGPIVMEALF